MRQDLPDLVARFIHRCLPDGAPVGAVGTLLHQTGTMRLGPDKPWMPFSAEQTIDAHTTGFVWHARMKMAPLVTAVVDDAFEHGHGRLDAKVWGVIPVAHERGLDLDRGEAQRYLAELPWCPWALSHNPDLHFHVQSERVVRVWAFNPDTYVDLRFDEHGDIVGARTSTRSRGDEGEQPWEGRFWDYRDFDGVRAPAQGEVWWEPAHEDRCVYWSGTVTDLHVRTAPSPARTDSPQG